MGVRAVQAGRRLQAEGGHGDPAVAVAWLANCLGSRGERLRAGWLVLSGGLTAPVPLEPGQAVTAELDGLGSVEVYPR